MQAVSGIAWQWVYIRAGQDAMPLAEMTFSSLFSVANSKKYKSDFFVVILPVSYWCAAALLINVMNTQCAETSRVVQRWHAGNWAPETEVRGFTGLFYHWFLSLTHLVLFHSPPSTSLHSNSIPPLIIIQNRYIHLLIHLFSELYNGMLRDTLY